MYKLGEMASASGLSTRVLADWLDRGHIPAARTGKGRAREFTRDDVVRAALVTELTRLGLPIAEAAKAAATFSDEADADRDASEPFPHGKTLLVIDEDGSRCINVTASREDFDSAMAAVYGGARSTIVVNVAGVIANVDRALEAGPRERSPATMLFRHGRQMHTA